MSAAEACNVVDIFTRREVSPDGARHMDETQREERRRKIRAMVQTHAELIAVDRQTIESANVRIQQGMHALAVLGQEEQLLDAPQ